MDRFSPAAIFYVNAATLENIRPFCPVSAFVPTFPTTPGCWDARDMEFADSYKPTSLSSMIPTSLEKRLSVAKWGK
jgi:hypothetical protein